MANKLLEKIHELLPVVDSDWKPHLDRLGIWGNVFNLYAEAPDGPTANKLLAFIVLAYNYQSEMIELSKDRLEVKRRIMIRVAGLSYTESKILADAAVGLNTVVNKVAAWHVEEQKDWRWGDIISKIEYHSRVNADVSLELDLDSDGAKKLEAATKLRRDAAIMWDEIRREFLPLDNALTAEGKPKITDNIKVSDFTSWEGYIRQKNFEKKRLQQEEENTAEMLKESKRQEKENNKIQKDSAKV
jgi:hypothetical protein